MRSREDPDPGLGYDEVRRIPRIDPKPADLVASLADLVEGYRAAPPQGVAVDFHAESESLVTRFDARLLHRAVRNLIENIAEEHGGGVMARNRPEGGLEVVVTLPV